MPKLTRNIIDNLKRPERGQIIVRDEALPGFGVRLTPNHISFIAEGRLSGKSKRLTIGSYAAMDIDAARVQAHHILAEMAAGREPTVKQAEPIMNLKTALDQFLVSRDIKPDTKLRYRKTIENNLADWLELPLNEITKNMVEIRHKALVGPTRCGTDGKSRANSTFETLRVVMKWAADRYLVNGSPLANPVDRLNQNRQWHKLEPRQGTIPDHRLKEFYQLVMGEPKFARDYLLFLIFSALRKGEARSLKWSDIDWQKKTLTVPMNKSKRMHVLPLTEMLIAILESRKDNGSLFVFPGRDGGHLTVPRASWERLRRLLGWNWLLHDLRRSALSAGEKAGVPFLALKAIAGHSVERSVIERYIVLDAEFVRVHLETLNGRLLQLMETSLEQWTSDDQSVRSGNFDQEAMKPGDQKVHMVASLIEQEKELAPILVAASDWEEEIYF